EGQCSGRIDEIVDRDVAACTGRGQGEVTGSERSTVADVAVGGYIEFTSRGVSAGEVNTTCGVSNEYRAAGIDGQVGRVDVESGARIDTNVVRCVQSDLRSNKTTSNVRVDDAVVRTYRDAC